MGKGFLVWLAVIGITVGILGLSFGLWQMGCRATADARSFMVATNYNTAVTNYNKLEWMYKQLLAKYDTCMDAHKFGGRSD